MGGNSPSRPGPLHQKNERHHERKRERQNEKAIDVRQGIRLLLNPAREERVRTGAMRVSATEQPSRRSHRLIEHAIPKSGLFGETSVMELCAPRQDGGDK